MNGFFYRHEERTAMRDVKCLWDTYWPLGQEDSMLTSEGVGCLDQDVPSIHKYVSSARYRAWHARPLTELLWAMSQAWFYMHYLHGDGDWGDQERRITKMFWILNEGMEGYQEGVSVEVDDFFRGLLFLFHCEVENQC